MVKLTRIYTKGGDKGLTSLGRGGRVPKHDLRVEAYGTVDEANSTIGMVRAVIARTVKKDRRRHEVEAMLARIQNDLFDLGADLCAPEDGRKAEGRLRIAPAQARGTAIGVYNTTQTLGLFCGGLAGGWIGGTFGARAVFGACAGLVLAWLAVAAGMRGPTHAVNPIKG